MKNDKMLAIGTKVSLGLAMMVAPSMAMADPASPATFGSAAILTNRPCTTTASGDCQLGPTRTFTQYAGGAGSAFSTSATNENNSGAAGSAYSSFAQNAVPTLGVASFAGATTRTGASALAYQTFTYSGSAAINIALSGTLHYVGSGNLTPYSMSGVEAGGAGGFNANLTIQPLSILAGAGTSGQDLITNLSPLTDCSAGATAATFASSQGLGAGEHSIAVSLTTACDGGAITIQPGQSFVILTAVQALSNLGGYIDASHTFSSYFDPQKTVFTDTGRAVGAQFLADSIAAIPEPASWSMMILGFGLGGAALRRRARPSLAPA